MDLYISDTQQVVACNGASALFQPGVARALRPSLIGPALTAGVRLLGVSAPAPAPVPVEPPVALTAVIAAIQDLMAEGDPKLFAVTGEPKLAPIRAKAGKGVTDALRDEAWALIQANTEA